MKKKANFKKVSVAQVKAAIRKARRKKTRKREKSVQAAVVDIIQRSY